MPSETGTGSTTPATDEKNLPWAAIPRFVPGTTDVSEYVRKLEFLAAMWPQEHLALLAPRAALLCEGTAFKKIALLSPDKLKTSDLSGIQLLVTTLGGAWGQTALEKSYDSFEKAIYGTVQKPDETHDSYLARHDVHFEELKAQGTTLDQIRAYVLLRQSQLSAEDRKRIVVEQGGKLEYSKVVPAIRLLGSRVFSDLQGQRGAMRNKVYDANVLEENPADEPDRQPAASAFVAPSEEQEVDLDPEFMETMMAAEDADALQVQGFEEELESFFQETPELQEALVSYLEARSRLLAKRRNRGFWPPSATSGGKAKGRFGKGKGRGKGGREQLLQRIARSTCRACGEKGHWKAECPKYGKPGSMSSGQNKTEAATSVAEVIDPSEFAMVTGANAEDELFSTLPVSTMSLEEAHFSSASECQIRRRLISLAQRKPPKGENP